VAGPFKIESKAFTIAAKGRPAETTAPVVAAEEPAKSRCAAVIIIIGIIALIAVAMALYKKKATV